MAGQMHDFGGVQQRFGGHTTPQNAEPADFFATLYHCRLQPRSEEHTSELQSPYDIVCRLLLEKKSICSQAHRPTTSRASVPHRPFQFGSLAIAPPPWSSNRSSPTSATIHSSAPRCRTPFTNST